MIPNFEIKRFNELSLSELYEVLALRSEVFIVEQNCPYQDVDGKDDKAIHLIGHYDGVLVAYARLFDTGEYFDTASIGRVMVRQQYRNRKWGHDLMDAAIHFISTIYGTETITISAQHYLLKFYKLHGFKSVGEIYAEDGIPHIRMLRN